MKVRSLGLCCLCFLFAAWMNAFALDREAFTFTKYDLDARIEPEQQRLGVRGKITLRNDSAIAQKLAVLQISSSLSWRSIRAGGKQLQFVAQPYTSDIDHTGALSEAIVTLPEAVAPKGSVDLEIAYEGLIVLDATRLTRIGAPEAQANSSDWDQISTKFTGVRGVGYVAWYPIAAEAVDLSDKSNLFDVLGGWKLRESASTMHLKIRVFRDDGERPAELLVNEASCAVMYEAEGRPQQYSADCTYQPLGLVVPTVVAAIFDEAIDRPAGRVHYLHGHSSSATAYADASEKVAPLVQEWFGPARHKVDTADLIDSEAAPFESGSLLLTPLTSSDAKLDGLLGAHQLTHASFSSPRPWIDEGISIFAQVLFLESQNGRPFAVDYMASHRGAIMSAEKQPAVAESESARSLVNTADEQLYRSKAMCVWWMLRDMVGDQGLKKALASYRPVQDTEASYMPRLIQAQSQRDLEWFFDDWVYRDRGLPDFKVASAFVRKTLPEGYMVTITVEDLGAAGAEVPVIVKFAGGEISKRLVVHGKSNGVIRVQVPKTPEEIVVNDGSVPESDMTNNTFGIEADEKAQ